MPLGTGGPLKKAEKLIGYDKPFIMLNGDIYTDINYRELLETHRKTGALATIALCKSKPMQFWRSRPQGNLIRRFVEKPVRVYLNNLINAGAYALSPSLHIHS
jgi:mannose-1-phosphate guanylyltransferase